MNSVDRDPIEAIKGKIDLVEFVQQYLPLKRAGINFVGRCPFHDEKTPSFTVSPERQSFKCFGCGKGGDIFSFIMEKEGITFPEALQILAERTGTELPRRSPAEKQERGQKQSLYALNEALAAFWHALLIRHIKAESARQYLARRRVTTASINDFRLGLAPPVAATNDFLQKKGFSAETRRLAGDPARFAGRLIFPLADITGRVVGFTGRLLPENEELAGRAGPKYWNTPQTPLFNKSEALFGIHLAKETLRRERVAIIAEGQMDVIGLFQAGLRNAVASSGTALTEQQLRLLARFADELVFAYDGDEAGVEAARRGFTLALAADLNIAVMNLPEGEDPGSLAAKKPATLKRLYESRQPVIGWLLEQAVQKFGAATPSGQKAVAKEVLPWVKRLASAVEQRGWLDIIAERIRTTTEALTLEMNKRPAAAGVNPTRERPATSNQGTTKTDDLTLLLGLVSQHPTFLADRPALPEIAAITEQSKPSRQEINLQNEAIMLAQKEFAGLSLEEQRSEAERLYQKIVFEQKKRDQVMSLK